MKNELAARWLRREWRAWCCLLPQEIIPVALGIVAFLCITGGRILQPGYTDWLMRGDAAQYWTGWQFFRRAPYWQWPLGAIPDYGMEISSSIAFTVSLPLLAFIFKLLNPLLPEAFQYFGFWILLCFVLQALFAWKLLSLFSRDKWLLLIGTLFFTIAPSFLWRLHIHCTLAAHWVLLAGLYLYFSRDFSLRRWAALLIVTALIHAYLLVMVLALWAADMAQRCWRRQCSLKKAGLAALYLISSVLMVMWATGYFMIAEGYQQGGFGIFRMNLVSLVDPGHVWSEVVPSPKEGPGDYEGFNYLGLGMLELGCLAIYLYLCSKKEKSQAKLLPLAIICLLLSLYALSDQIAIGETTLFNYAVPAALAPLINTFRVSGRFFWPVYYCIYLGIFYILFTRLSRQLAAGICTVMLCIQIADSANVWTSLRQQFNEASPWSVAMRSPLWDKFAHHYKNVIVVLPQNRPGYWLDITQFAVRHRMAINAGYFARVDTAKLAEARAKLANAIAHNEFSQDSLYIFEDDNLWALVSSQPTGTDFIGVADGFRLLAPHWSVDNTGN